MTTHAAEAEAASPSRGNPTGPDPAEAHAPGNASVTAITRGDLAALAACGLSLILSLVLLAWGLSRGTESGGPTVVHWTSQSAASAATSSATAAGPMALAGSADGGDRLLSALPAVTQRQAALLDDAELESLTARTTRANVGRVEGEIPRAQRWEVFIPEGLTLAEYSQQLDGVGIEVGMLTGDGTIEYVTGISQLTPGRRQGTASDEHRLYLAWTRADLLAADRELLAQVGLDAKDKVVLQFFPEAIEQKLAELETAFANRPADRIYRTRFGIQKTITGFEFHVIEQTQR
jgi:hypothetical protein